MFAEIEEILSPLTYCGAADRQRLKTLEAIDKLILILEEQLD